ncbi:MAG: OmpA family protein [Thalassospira sp.]|uniref:OmpA family protein n=1 Tax=Thalassospira sp. TaxID=1912094 RepID=UPI0032EBD566
MKGYSKISVLAMTAALGTTAVFGSDASAQQYSPVSVDNSVQVNWDVADGVGGQPTVPQYLSSNVSRDHIVMPGGDLIFPEVKPRSTFLANDQFADASTLGGYEGDFETVIIDGASGGSAFPTQSEFYGVSGAPSGGYEAAVAMDDGANQTIALRQPEPASAPRNKPVAPVAAASTASASSSVNAPTPLSKPEPAPAPAPVMAEAAPEPVTAPAPAAETAEMVEPPKAPPLMSEESKAPAAPAAPIVEPIANANEVAPAPTPAPDTTQSAPSMAEAAPKPKAAPAPEPTAPAAEEASIPPAAKTPEPMPSLGADEYSLGFAADSFELSNAAKSELNQVISAMNKDDSLRIQLQAYAAGDGANASKARRLSLSRALQVRSYLIDQGVRSTRIDVRALGANVPSGPADRVDIKTVQR